jgi:hypothetical protein
MKKDFLRNLQRDLDSSPDLILKYANIGVHPPTTKLRSNPYDLAFLPRRGKGPFHAVDTHYNLFGKKSITKRPRHLGVLPRFSDTDLRRFVKENYGTVLPRVFDLEKAWDLWEDIREWLLVIVKKGNVIPKTDEIDHPLYDSWGSKIDVPQRQELTLWPSPFINLKVCIVCGRFWDEKKHVGRPKGFCPECRNFRRLRADRMERARKEQKENRWNRGLGRWVIEQLKSKEVPENQIKVLKKRHTPNYVIKLYEFAIPQDLKQ